MADVREELAHADPGGPDEQLAETAAIIRVGGALELHGGSGGQGFAVVVSTSNGAVARRFHAAVRRITGDHPDIEVHAPHGIQHATRYRLRLAGAPEVLARAGVVDRDGQLQQLPPPQLTGTPGTKAAYLRGALMVGGSLSDPRRATHMEVATTSEPGAIHLAQLLRDVDAPSAQVSAYRDGWRVTVKTAPHVGAVLAAVGAHQSFLRWDEGKLRKELRAAANRAANADQANVARSVAASGRQVEAIHRVIANVGLAQLPSNIADVALARLANPEASLAQLGQLLDPPVGKATVHRRMHHLLSLADDP